MSRRTRPLRLALSLVMGLLLAFAGDALAGLELQPFEARFQVSRNGLTLGTMAIRFSLDQQGGYHYTGHTQPGDLIGLFISDEVQETSQGRYEKGRIIPNRYEYLQDYGKRKKRTELDFDWQADQVWTDSEGQRWAQPLQDNTHDKYSQQLALRLDLAKGKREISYPVADGGRIKTYHYRVVGEDHIKLPYGHLKCVRVRRSKETHAPDYTIWVAPELDYLPVKIERQRSSGKYAIELMQFNPVNPSPP